MLLLLAPSAAWAARGTTRDALERLEELLELRREDGRLQVESIAPTILVSARARYAASEGWIEAEALRLLIQALGPGGVRACEACALPRTESAPGRLTRHTGPASLEEIIRLDDRYRGASARAKTATWIDETASGVSMRIVDLRSGRVVFAQNVDPELREYTGSARSFRLSEELERRSRGDALTHIFTDLALYPGQHVSMEWADQWGATNNNLSGIVFSFYDPVVGIGLTYHRVLEWQHLLVGGQLILSVPTAIVQTQTDEDTELVDPLLTAVGMVRYPLWGSNYAALLAVSTNGEVGLGITLLNTSLIPVLP